MGTLVGMSRRAGEGEFGDPHEANAQSDGADDGGELIGRSTTIASAIDRQWSADEEDEQSDRRADEHAWGVDAIRVEVISHEGHRHDEEREDETIDEGERHGSAVAPHWGP